MKRVATRLPLLVALLAMAAFDTKTKPNADGNEWGSMLIPPADADYAQWITPTSVQTDKLTGNEHAEIAHLCMLQMGWTSLYDPKNLPAVIDYNESIFRSKMPRIGLPEGIQSRDVSATPLIERGIPHPARFAGTPDFSYTIYDWINKNNKKLCPALPPDADEYELCHEFMGWMGALNANHFGIQAEKTYKHYHGLALQMAAHAKSLRDGVEEARAAGTLDEEEAMEYVREAELQALAYEGFAQHFIQDRWSMGHMWNRFNGPDYPSLDNKTLKHNLGTGAISGIIHGAEAILKRYLQERLPKWFRPVPKTADPMCSPLVEKKKKAVPVQYSPNGGPNLQENGVGDYRFADMLRGKFGDTYGYQLMDLDVAEQKASMLRCAKAGWADIARAFYDNGDGTYGSLKLPIGADTPRFDAAVDRASGDGGATRCWSGWATNQAVHVGISNFGQSGLLSVLLRSGQVFSFVFKFEKLVRPIRITPGEFGRLVMRVRRIAKKRPLETTLARGIDLGWFNGARPGNEYASSIPADYYEPYQPLDFAEPLENLPVHSDEYDKPEKGDRPGRDKHTVFGLFSKANTWWYCDEAQTILSHDKSKPIDDPEQGTRWPVPLPANPSAETKIQLERRRDACTHIAKRLYKSTMPFYMLTRPADPPAESRRLGFGGAGAAEVGSACETLARIPDSMKVDDANAGAYWKDNPHELHPGYVVGPDPMDPQTTGPFALDTTFGEKYATGAYRSLVNWCMALPVVNVDSEGFVFDGVGARTVVTPGYGLFEQISFSPADQNPEVTLYGFNFGTTAGRVKLVSRNKCVNTVAVTEFADVVAWSDTEITIKIPITRFPPDVYEVTIIRDDRDPSNSRVRSVGLALLDIRKAAYTSVMPAGPPLSILEDSKLYRGIHPFCEGGTVLDHTIHDCTDVDAGQLESCGTPGSAVGDLLWDIANPAQAPMPGPYTGHQWNVTAIGTCDFLPFPFAPCPDSPPATYGLTYLVERLEPGSLFEPERSWRFTLAWKRKDAP